MLRFNDNRRKIMLIELLCFLFLGLAIFSFIIFVPNTIDATWFSVSSLLIGIVAIASMLKYLLYWKVIVISDQGIYEEYYGIDFSTPYKIKEVLTWDRIKSINVKHEKYYGKNRPCSLMFVYWDDRRSLEYYHIGTEGFYFFNYKGDKYDPQIIDELMMISKQHSINISYE